VGETKKPKKKEKEKRPENEKTFFSSCQDDSGRRARVPSHTAESSSSEGKIPYAHCFDAYG
jgi:hypothetical protein